MSDTDAVIIGSGPNGLSAAVTLAQAGANVLVLEARDTIGGGTRTEELTLPGYLHDVCSAAHPMGVLSPFFRTLPLKEHGLNWIHPTASVAHPLDDQPAVIFRKSLDETAADLGNTDEKSYKNLMRGFLKNPHGLLKDALAPAGIPTHPLLMARFGMHAIWSARSLSNRFSGERAKALIAGCAAHSILPLERMITAAVAMMFLITGHTETWPVAEGGSRAITDSLASYLKSLNGKIETSRTIKSIQDLPPARIYLFDTSPNQVASIAGPVLPAGYLKRLSKYRYGPGIFKLDWALSGSIPWKDNRCLGASTVHVGGAFNEIAAGEAAVWRGEHPEKPFVLITQQSEFDKKRAPSGKHTGWAYIHVPAGSTIDMTEVIEKQIERFAPGFRDLVLARHATFTADSEKENANYVGGAITGGVTDAAQLFTRPVARINPYSTPNPRVFICSASSPPGGGVHGMCGHYAAKSAIKHLGKFKAESLA